jgi:hypothetical protein
MRMGFLRGRIYSGTSTAATRNHGHREDLRRLGPCEAQGGSGDKWVIWKEQGGTTVRRDELECQKWRQGRRGELGR